MQPENQVNQTAPQDPILNQPVAPIVPDSPPFSEPTQIVSKTNWTVTVLFLILGIVIGVAGFWVYQKYFSKQSPVINGSVPSPSPMATTDPTADWKTYTSQYYSFKYPSNWEITSDNNLGLRLQPLNAPNKYEPVISFSAIDNSSNMSFEQLHEKAKNDEIYMGNYDPSKTAAKISDEVATYLQDKNCEPYLCDSFTVLHNNKIYFVGNIFSSLDEKEGQRQLLNQVLSTFKFTDRNSQEVSGNKIELNTLNRSAGETTPKKIAFTYDRKPGDKLFLEKDKDDKIIDTAFRVERNNVSLKISPSYEGFPRAFSTKSTDIINNSNISSLPVYRLPNFDYQQNSYIYVNNYKDTTVCGDSKPNTVSCSASNIETNKNIGLGVLCNSPTSEVSECDQIVKTLNFSWQ